MYIYIYISLSQGSEHVRQEDDCCLPQCPFLLGHVEAIAPRQIRSPNWHRRVRAKRSKARKRVRAARFAGRPAARRDFSLLWWHHSGPSGVGMGKRNTWQGRGGRYASQPSQPLSKSWSVWQGAWGRASQDRNWRSNQVDFPGYDNAWEEEPITPVRETRYPSASADQFTRQVQNAVNGARKIDTRVAKLTEERQEKERRWKAYVAKSRNAFVTEYMKYQANMGRIDKELQEAQDSQKAAHQQVRGVAIGEMETTSTQAIASEEWDDVMSSAISVEAPPDLDPDTVRLAMQIMEQRRNGIAVPHFGGDGQTTPPQRHTPSPIMTPPPVRKADGYLAGQGNAPGAPYSTSPGAAGVGTHLGAPMDTARPAEAHVDTEKAPEAHKAVPPKPPKQRSPVKTHTKPERTACAGVPLSDKLDAKRKSAMHPFGRPLVPAAPEIAASLEVEKETVEDLSDQEREDAAPDGTGTPSPGFGKME